MIDDAKLNAPKGLRRIDSGSSSFFYKRLFPIFWFGFFGIGITISIWLAATRQNLFSQLVGDLVLVLLTCVVMMVFGLVLMKRLVWNLVDEVYDGGDFLLVRNRGLEERISLSNLVNVNVMTYMNPPRITLRLSAPGGFGSEIAFIPIGRFSYKTFGRNEIAEDLIVRVDAARRR